MTLLHDMGVAGFVTFQLVLFGTVLAALVHPIFLAALFHDVITGSIISNKANIAGVALIALYATTFIAGYVATLALSLVGLSRRRLMVHAHVLYLVPVLWILLSIAAWRALIQLIYAPHHWDKTEHGFAKTSRQRRDTAQNSVVQDSRR